MTPEEIIAGLRFIHCGGRREVQAAIDYIEEHQWRKVNEELPKKSGIIDIYGCDGEGMMWFDADSDDIPYQLQGVTHWRYRDDADVSLD